MILSLIIRSCLSSPVSKSSILYHASVCRVNELPDSQHGRQCPRATRRGINSILFPEGASRRLYHHADITNSNHLRTELHTPLAHRRSHNRSPDYLLQHLLRSPDRMDQYHGHALGPHRLLRFQGAVQAAFLPVYTDRERLDSDRCRSSRNYAAWLRFCWCDSSSGVPAEGWRGWTGG